MGCQLSGSVTLLRAGALAATVMAFASTPRAAAAQPDPRYWRYDQVVARLEQWASEHPDILHLEEIGRTAVGMEPIWGAKISDYPSTDEPEATLILHAAQHSNEPNGTGAIMIMMDRLLSGYGNDPYITRIVDGLQIWFIPIVNVDGHRMVFEGVMLWNMWRKNMRDNNEDGRYSCPEDGVDLNRNWDFRWDQQPDSMYTSEYYRGPAPFSESEVVSLRDFILREQPLILMDYHSPFLHTPGNTIFWTWPAETGYGPDAPFFEPIAAELASRTQTEVDTTWYRAGAAAMSLAKEQNWVYANTGDCVLLMEISSTGFWQGAMVDTIATRVARGSSYLFDRALNGPGFTGEVVDASTLEPLDGTVEIQEAYNSAIGPHRTDPATGAFWRMLTGGDYTVIANAPGYAQKEFRVHVGSGWCFVSIRMTRLDPSFAGGGPRDGAPRALWAENPSRGGDGAVRFLVEGGGSPAKVDVLDPSGRIVRHLVDGVYGPGVHEVRLGGLPSGIYLLRYQAGARSFARKIVAQH